MATYINARRCISLFQGCTHLQLEVTAFRLFLPDDDMRIFALRFKPDQDLKESLNKFVSQQNITSGFMLTAIGSLKQATIRFADQKVSTVLHEKFEILSLNGTLSTNGLHLHIALSDQEGKTIGGHLDHGCIIYTTAEIVLGTSEEFTFMRTVDEQTGFKELEIRQNILGGGHDN